MSIVDFLVSEAQPNYIEQVATIALRWQNIFTSEFEIGLTNENFVHRFADYIETKKSSDDEVLQLISDLWSLTWWRGPKIDDACSSRIIQRAIAIFRGILDKPNLFQQSVPRSKARREHSVFVGTLQDPLHSPSRGAVDYLAGLAGDVNLERVDVYYSGTLTHRMRAYIDDRLANLVHLRGINFFNLDSIGDLLSHVIVRGPCSFHFWCAPALSPWVSAMSLIGPTIMFVCGDEAPVQYADVYWYFHENEYIEKHWERRGAPKSFINNYFFSQSGPTPISGQNITIERQSACWSEQKFVISTVGNRLSIDLTEIFVTGMESILSRHPNCIWLIVGSLPEYLENAFQLGFGPQFRYVNYESRLAELMTLVDVFANPFRPGGGDSAFISMKSGSVIMTLNEGDVASFVPPEHRANSSDEFFANLSNLIENKDEMAGWRSVQKIHLNKMNDQTAFLKSLKQMIKLAHERYEARQFTPLVDIIDGN